MRVMGVARKDGRCSAYRKSISRSNLVVSSLKAPPFRFFFLSPTHVLLPPPPFSPVSPPSSLSFATPYIPLTLSTTTVFLAMVRILCIASLALAAVSAVSGHILRHRKNPPQGWETDILQVHSLLAVYLKTSFSASLAALSPIPRSLLDVGLSE